MASTRNAGSKGRMEHVIDTLATSLGNTVGSVASSGLLFVIFAVIWIAFASAVVWSQGSLDETWQRVRDLPLLVQGFAWLLLLPVMAGLWIWETTWPLVVRLVLVAGLAGWTLLVFPKPWK